MILSKKKKLFKKIEDYEVIIFDLDNTIYNSSLYEDGVFKIISDYLYKKINIKIQLILNIMTLLKEWENPFLGEFQEL